MNVIKAASLALLVAGLSAMYAEPAQSAEAEFISAGHAVGTLSGRCVDYKYHHQRKCICCEPPIKTVIMVKDVRSCCIVPVEVCLPGCCVKPPAVHCRAALFGRSISTYDFCCGFRIKVVVDKCGDLTVHYYGKI